MRFHFGWSPGKRSPEISEKEPGFSPLPVKQGSEQASPVEVKLGLTTAGLVKNRGQVLGI
jgi:hypothetical protein